MTNHRWMRRLLIATALCALAGCEKPQADTPPAAQPPSTTPAQPSTPTPELAALLPTVDAAWQTPAVTRASTKEEIWEIIDGEADQYHAYDLIDLTHAVYAGPQDAKLVIDIYRMPTAADAFGAYTLWRSSAEDVFAAPAAGAWVEDSLNFAAGRYFVRLKADNAGDPKALLRGLQAQMLAKMPHDLPQIAHLPALPPADQKPDSVLYSKRDYRGREFLDNVVSAQYIPEGREHELFIADLKDPAAAAEAMDAWKKSIPEATFTPGDWPTLKWADEFDGPMTVIQAGPYLVGATQGQGEAALTVAKALGNQAKR